MTPETKRRAILLALLASVFAGGYFFLRGALFERVQETVPSDPSPEVAREPYLALAELLTAGGLPTETASSRAPLPPADHVLWWLAPRRPSETGRLLEWVEAGGHLIVNPWGDGSLLDPVGVGVFFAEDADEDDHLSRPEFVTTRTDWPKLYATEDADLVWTEGASDAAWNLTVRHGEGLVTVINGPAFLRNEALAREDNALVAWYLVRADEGRAAVRLVTRSPRPAIWNVLGPEAVPLAVSLGLLALAGVWVHARRMGPVAPSPSRDRRHLAEHLRASGEFLWSVGCEDVLLRAEQDALAEHFRRTGRGAASDRDLVREASAAAERAGLDPAAVAHALKVRELRDRDRFLAYVRLLEGLRRDRETS